MTDQAAEDAGTPERRGRPLLMQLLSWAAACGCFYLVYGRIAAAAARQSQTPLAYLLEFIGEADWWLWLGLMIPYSIFFFLVDAHASWRVIRWYNAPDIRLRDVLPIRASAYILSMLNEQVGKGAMSLYLWRRYHVPGWEAVSSMILLGMVEIYQLLLFSSVGVMLYFELVQQASTQLPLPRILLTVYVVAAVYFPIHLLYFSGRIFPNSGLRDAKVLYALRKARARDYLLVLLFKAPNLLMAVAVYTLALELFHVQVYTGRWASFAVSAGSV